jgi:hypothetical protein
MDPAPAGAVNEAARHARAERAHRPSASRAGSDRRSDSTTLVLLGVDHSAQLGAPRYHPGYFRAFFDRVRPTAICIERSPEEFARGDYYEFTYEAQHIAVPYARAHGVDLCPIDWLPSRDDERLAFGRLEVVDPPVVRPSSGFQTFLRLDSASLQRTLLFADSEPAEHETRAFFDAPRAPGPRDFPRRLDLYRTFMQAMRIRAAVRAHEGATILVVVGSLHKEDIEHVLAGTRGLRIVQASAYGPPTDAEASARLEPQDLAAILSFNLLGLQGPDGPVDWPWIAEALRRFGAARPAAPELALFQARYDVLTRHTAPAMAAATYEHIAAMTDSSATFTFTGVEDTRRIDSYYDPFGNLSVRQRALVEAAREWVRAGQADRARRIRDELFAGGTWSSPERGEFDVYWDRYIDRATRG